MHDHPEHTDEPQPPSNKGRLLIGAGIVAVLIVLVALHLTGVIGPGSH